MLDVQVSDKPETEIVHAPVGVFQGSPPDLSWSVELLTASPSGTLIFHVFSAIAEYERGTNRERTMAGIAAAQRAGTRFGRPATISPAQWEQATRLMKSDPPPTVTELATLLGVSRQAIYRRQDADRAAMVLDKAR